MGVNISRIVEIQISNKTQNITLRNPRTHFFSGQIFSDHRPSVSPGSSSTYRFTNNSGFWACKGLLAYEADSFTLAIFFSNPTNYDLFAVEMGLELSLEKVHRRHLDQAYDRLVGISQGSSDQAVFPCAILKEPQEKAQLSAGPVTVTATMVRSRGVVIKVEVEERGNSGSDTGMESPGPARHVQEK